MRIAHRGAVPRIHPDATVAPGAIVSGDVTVAAGARILHGAVLTAEDGTVAVGKDTVVLEHAVVRGRAGHPAIIGAHVMIGPHAHVNGAAIGDRAFIATGASVFPGAVVGDGAEVRINAVVQVNTTLDAGAVVPIGWVAVGAPAELYSPDHHEEIWAVQRTLDFPGTVYGVDRDAGMAEIMRRQSAFYAPHDDDEILG
ncbi:gamma carbonic anhydrase family protein [Agromyces sp. CFH 90414]|uniref:Gamma carbonic anhydrase family protein n=1 Tax=Agromyces agglutinans TaxID=2662258 RepID=A0A6I2FBD7_9MICO|nr:gamma carbonic anhydrase family protein [Agromyces agglutinans]MRG58498.1 gamma carbonic anhydrase family protein [Agromyces agglutinans]